METEGKEKMEQVGEQGITAADGAAATDGNEQTERTLEENFALLDQKIAQLEDSEISLEDSFRIYKEGMELLKECSAKIDTVEKKMLQINQDGTITEFGI